MIRVALLTFFVVSAFLIALALLNRDADSSASTPAKSKVTVKRSVAQTEAEPSCNTCPLPTN